MTFFPDISTPRRHTNPMAQVIAALVERHGRWRVLRAALFAGQPRRRHSKHPQVPDRLRRDLGLPPRHAPQTETRFRDPIL